MSEWTKDCWATPPHIVQELEKEFGRFHLDPCCTEKTAKAPKFFTPRQNGLRQKWSGKVFLNPPYSNPGPWLEKACIEIRIGKVPLVVALIPASTDTGWFHDFVKDHATIRYIRGRIQFLDENGNPGTSPRQPVLFAIYKSKELTE